MKRLFSGTLLEVPWLKLKKNRLGMLCLGFLLLLYLGLLFQGFLAPYTANHDFRTKPYHPPHAINWFHNGRFTGPFVYEYELANPYTKQYRTNRSLTHPLTLFAKGDTWRFLFVFETDLHLFGTTDGAPVFLFGTDHLGRDLFSRMVYGSTISLTIGFVSIFLALFGGIIIGGLAGYIGRFVDWTVMRICETIMLLPTFYFFLFLRATMPTDISPGEKFLFITAILAIPGWAGSARSIRNWVLSLKNADFVSAAVIGGTPRFTILWRHIIPQIRNILILNITLSVPAVILGETGLSFLNLGITEPSVSWGMLMSSAMDINVLINYPWTLAPAILIILTVFSFFTFGYALKDAFDPKSGGETA